MRGAAGGAAAFRAARLRLRCRAARLSRGLPPGGGVACWTVRADSRRAERAGTVGPGFKVRCGRSPRAGPRGLAVDGARTPSARGPAASGPFHQGVTVLLRRLVDRRDIKLPATGCPGLPRRDCSRTPREEGPRELPRPGRAGSARCSGFLSVPGRLPKPLVSGSRRVYRVSLLGRPRRPSAQRGGSVEPVGGGTEAPPPESFPVEEPASSEGAGSRTGEPAVTV